MVLPIFILKIIEFTNMERFISLRMLEFAFRIGRPDDLKSLIIFGARNEKISWLNKSEELKFLENLGKHLILKKYRHENVSVN